jgi:S-formylglutathione hydrolase
MSGTWTQEMIAGIPADVYAPSGQPHFGVLHLHDLDRETLRDRPAFTRRFEELRLVGVCPHGQRCWWGDRICAEFDAQVTPERYLLDSVLPFYQERWGLAPRAVGLHGIGMGGQGALRLAFKRPDVFAVVAALAAAVDAYELYGQGTPLDAMYETREHCRQDTATLHIHPSHYPPHIFFGIDPEDVQWFRGNDRLHEKLSALGVPHEVDFTTRAGGHAWRYYDHMAERALRFVHGGLEQQSRRLL